MTLPNQLTILRILLSPVAVFLLLAQDPVAVRLGTAVFIIASLTDWYDGHFARKYGYVTDWGKFLDPLADKVLISSILLSFVLLNHLQAIWVMIIVIRDVIVTALRGYMMMNDKVIAANTFAKWKTFSQNILVYLVLIYINFSGPLTPDSPSLGFISYRFIDIFAQVVAYYTLLTGLFYLYDNRKPLIELFGLFYRWIIPFNLLPEMSKDSDEDQPKNSDGK
ncbi:CDP-diacylglycerol--glycerol-3-phosphate 3-phosphatidyltransferase [candidate division KSB1 bacterium]